MQKYNFCLLVLSLLSVTVSARAETLDDDAIRKIYADNRDAIHDPVKTEALMQARLDDNYSLKLTVERNFDGKPLQKTVQSQTKDAAIHSTIDSIKHMNIDKYELNVVSIDYSDDRKYAYVKDSASATGKVDAPSQDGGAMHTVQFNVTENCKNTLALVGDQVKIMDAQCEDKVVVVNPDSKTNP